jgi:hypothetical protein
MDDKFALIWERVLQAHDHVALALVREIEMVKTCSWESRRKQRRLEIQELLPVDLLEADGHQILGA